MPYQSLDSAKIVETAERLSSRIEERFPDSGLSRLSRKMLEVTRAAQERSAWIAEPNWAVRMLAVVTIAALVLILIFVLRTSVIPRQNFGLDLVTLIQLVDAATNDVILLAAAVFSVITIEARLKRGKALAAIHELRVISHIVDMHQLTKDPERIIKGGPSTPSSPAEKQMTAFELSRYLDYCSELLSICAKTGVLYVQKFDDPVVVNAVQDIESLTNGLSQKIWQKLVILHSVKI